MFDFLFRNAGFTPGDAARLRRIEQKLDVMLKHLQVVFVEPSPGEDLMEPVRALADRGEKIEAIKRHRELTGAGLAEAKQAVEAYLSRKS
jgi:ribosomal protein L7/L12